ncbi:hypothetical protein ABBQ38_010663 [Trebouxia sp. C0009 RCD-2024]
MFKCSAFELLFDNDNGLLPLETIVGKYYRSISNWAAVNRRHRSGRSQKNTVFAIATTLYNYHAAEYFEQHLSLQTITPQPHPGQLIIRSADRTVQHKLKNAVPIGLALLGGLCCKHAL